MDSNRKVRFQGLSFVLTIPQQWVDDNDVRKGDTLNLEIINNKLIFSLKDKQIKQDDKGEEPVKV